MNPITDDVVCSLMEGLEQREKNSLAKAGRQLKKKSGATHRFLRLSKTRQTTEQKIAPLNAAHP